jgi:glycosyltransferase involved in cell wall biosynthesis
LEKVFILIPWFLPAYKAGGPIQSIANMVGQLNNGQYRFRIFCGNKDLDGKLLQSVAFDEWVNYNTNTDIRYSSNNDLLPILQRELKKEKPGILFINGIYSWQYNFKPLLFCSGLKKIISVRGMLHPGALSQKPLKKKIYLLFWKIAGLHKKSIFHATNEEEKIHIQNVFGKAVKIIVAPNFPKIGMALPVQKKVMDNLSLVSIGLISPMKNYLLVLESLQNCSGNIEYNIYGPVKDADYWHQCLGQIKKLPLNITVQYHGDVTPSEIEKTLQQNHVFILPSKSENFGHAIFEALSAGRPVITSNSTPWNNLKSLNAGININPEKREELIEAIHFFCGMSQDELVKWSAGAKTFAQNAVDIKQTINQYQQLFSIAN